MNIVVTKMNKPWNKRYYIQSSNQNNIMINECLIRKKMTQGLILNLIMRLIMQFDICIL